MTEFGERHPASGPLHDGRTDDTLEAAHMLADRGLRQVQDRRRPVKSPTVGNGHQTAQWRDIQDLTHWLHSTPISKDDQFHRVGPRSSRVMISECDQ
jgi:hypothetical protein